MRSGTGGGEANGDDVIARQSLDSAPDVDLQGVGVSLVQQTLKSLLGCVLIGMRHLHRKTPEGLEVAITDQLLPDSGTADLQNIRLGQQRGGFEGIAQNAAETGAIVQVHVVTAAVADLDFQRHWAHVREQLDLAELEALGSRHLRGQRFKLRKQGMRQEVLMSGPARRAIQL